MSPTMLSGCPSVSRQQLNKVTISKLENKIHWGSPSIQKLKFCYVAMRSSSPHQKFPEMGYGKATASEMLDSYRLLTMRGTFFSFYTTERDSVIFKFSLSGQMSLVSWGWVRTYCDFRQSRQVNESQIYNCNHRKEDMRKVTPDYAQEEEQGAIAAWRPHVIECRGVRWRLWLVRIMYHMESRCWDR